MSRKFIAGLILGTTITTTTILGNSYFYHKPNFHTHPKIRVSDAAVWTTVADIEDSLRDTPPINIGFDIDDTLLFPKTSFHVYYARYCPNDHEPYRPSCTQSQDFWDHLNRSGNLSPAKAIGTDLIEMHKRRGDNIFFITAREQSLKKPETMTETLKQTFDLKDINKVIYTGLKSLNPEKPGKTMAIQNNNIKIFYGDSDGDIAAAKAANIRGIRVIRAPNSQDNHDMPINGRYGEEVIIGSDV